MRRRMSRGRWSPESANEMSCAANCFERDGSRMIIRTKSLFALTFTAVLLIGCVDEPEEVIEEPLIIVGPRDLAGAVVTIDRKEVGALEPMVPAWLNWLSKKLFGRNHVTGDDVALIVELQGTPPGDPSAPRRKSGLQRLCRRVHLPGGPRTRCHLCLGEYPRQLALVRCRGTASVRLRRLGLCFGHRKDDRTQNRLPSHGRIGGMFASGRMGERRTNISLPQGGHDLHHGTPPRPRD